MATIVATEWKETELVNGVFGQLSTAGGRGPTNRFEIILILDLIDHGKAARRAHIVQ